MAVEAQVNAKRKRYSGYRSFEYLEPGVDYVEFKLAREIDRVPSRKVEVSAEQESRVQRLLDQCLVVSLHDHAFVTPEDPRQIFEYRRAGRDWTGYEGLSVSGLDAVFDCLMDGTALITSKAGWKWDDVIFDLGMRLSDIAHQDMVIRAETTQDVARAKQNGQIAFIPSLEAATPIENELDRLDILYGLGIRSSGIAYSEANTLGCGLREPRDGGLTEFGRLAVQRMNKLGIAIDISHSGDQTSLDTIAASSMPVFITHAGARALWNTRRMKPMGRGVTYTSRRGIGPTMMREAEPHRLSAGSMTRRALLRASLLLGAGSLLAACSRATDVQQVVPTATTASKPAAPAPVTAPTQAPAQPTLAPAAAGADVAQRRIRPLVLLTQPQANVPEEFEASRLAADEIKQLGVNLELRVMPWEQLSDLVWFNRGKWDMTAWQMVGRPERLDPDEFVFNLFHSSTAEKGYDFVGYSNPEYDKLAEQQRTETDKEKRRQILYQLQEIIARDSPYLFLVYPHANYAFNNEIWDAGSVVDAKGIGVKNYWTFVRATPKGSQKDMILNTLAPVQAINPLYISGATDSWITELIWDRLMRIEASGLPQPYAAEKIDWKDGTTVVATLRDGLKWHDGKPLTVDDVIFSFKAPAGSMSPMYKPFVSGIKEVRAIGDKQVEFRLSTPNAAFETSSLAKLNLIPQHVWEPVLKDLEAKDINAEKYQEDQPLGSGPFKFVNWKRSEEIVLTANPDHFEAPKMQRWILRDLPNVSATLGALQNGEINFLSDYTGDPVLLRDAVEQNKKLTLASTIVVGFRFLAPNERRPPFDDPAFRKALATAVAKDQVLQNIYHGFATAADSHVSKALEFWHAPGLPDPSKGDIAGARKILSDAGYEWDGEGHLLYPKGKTETLQPES